MNDTTPLISFFVQGEPRPKQSFRIGKGGGFTHPRVKAWQTDVAYEAERTMRQIGRFNEPFNAGQLFVRLVFFLGDHRRVDLDNLSKAILDGLNGICYDDDRQIVELHLKKTVIADKKQTLGVNVFIYAYQE